MTKQQAPAVRLTPVTVKSEAAAKALADARKRPVLAIDDSGKLVLCCRRTAKVKGWEVQKAMYTRGAAPAAPKAAKPAKGTRKVKAPTLSAAAADVAALLAGKEDRRQDTTTRAIIDRVATVTAEKVVEAVAAPAPKKAGRKNKQPA